MRTRSCRTVEFYFGPFMFLSMARISVPIKKRKLLKRGPLATLSTHLIKQHINRGLFILLKQSEKLSKKSKIYPYWVLFPEAFKCLSIIPFFPFLEYHWGTKTYYSHSTNEKWCTDRLWISKAHKDLKPETGSLCWLNPLARPFYPTRRGCLVNVEDVVCLYICS